MTTTARTASIAAAGALALALTGGTASAQPPVVEDVDRTFVSPFLTEQCGVEVTQHLWGHYATVTTDHRTITNFHFRSTLTAGDVVVDSRAFGPTMEIVQDDGSLTVVQLGVTMRNVPGSGTTGPFAGRTVLTIAPDGTETVEHEAGLRQDLTELCGVLTGSAG